MKTSQNADKALLHSHDLSYCNIDDIHQLCDEVFAYALYREHFILCDFMYILHILYRTSIVKG